MAFVAAEATAVLEAVLQFKDKTGRHIGDAFVQSPRTEVPGGVKLLNLKTVVSRTKASFASV